MRVITINTNGIRSAAKKGFFEWMAAQQADFICVQETKAQASQLAAAEFSPEGYSRYLNDAEKKGYSGTAIYARKPPLTVVTQTGIPHCDSEGRYVRLDYEQLSVVSLYMPSGSSGDDRQQVKYQMMAAMRDHFAQLKATGREIIICADWNIVHTEKDIKNWRGNQKNSGCLPEERAWLDALFYEDGWVDVFRRLNDKDEQYTWWSNRGQAWANNTGWRLDYHVVTPAIAERATAESIYRDQRFSDHAPFTVDYDIEY